MKFVTNKISTGKATSFGDFVKKLAESNASLNKTASTEAPAEKTEKTTNIANFGGKQAEPFGKKKEEGKKEDKKEDKKVEKESCGTACASSEKKASTKKKADNSEIPAANKGVTHKVDECCGAPTSGDGSEGSKGEAKKEEKKESSSRPRMTRIANLDSKTKNEWKTYWKKLYPSAYVDAMFADK